MIYSEDILFLMPADRELQFPAMSALQRHVNDYMAKMANQFKFMLPDKNPDFKFRYAVNMSADDWDFFQLLGIELTQAPEEIGPPDVVVDMRDDKLLAFKVAGSTKHAAQICSGLAGVEGLPFPKFRKCEMDWTMKTMLCGMPFFYPGATMVSEDEAVTMFKSGAQIGCYIGYQNWVSYMFAALGFPVIEILPTGKSETWLSKWMNPFYRVIEQGLEHRLMTSTIENLRGAVAWQSERIRAEEARATLTAQSKSSAANAVSTSGQV